MAVIHVLDKHTAELIAAGEVVERPASAVKELLENAIDANATQIEVSIEAGGVRLIEVSDNGTGIETEYISKAFIRHATSKIQTEDDLNHIHTLGFRGEALASIASVARVEVLTCTEQDEFACIYRIEGGEEFPIEAGARGVGTTIRVQNLFFNTPARMKFLKKDSSEGTFVSEVVSHIALSHPEIAFRFVREGKLQYKTPGDGNLRNTACAVLGREFARGLLPLEFREGNYHVYGLMTPPKSCRASRAMQYFYINGRFVKNRTMMAAMENAFKGTTMQGKFPGGILMLEMPAELVDVNVHPAKTEVRFARENDVFDAVYRAVRAALAQPGSGERLFSFGAVSEEKKEEQPTTEEEEMLSRGLSAVVVGQAEPAVLKKADKNRAKELFLPEEKTEPKKPRAEEMPPEENFILPSASVTIGRDTPIAQRISLFSPSQELTWEDEGKTQETPFPKARQESVLDIEPEGMIGEETKEAEAQPLLQNSFEDILTEALAENATKAGEDEPPVIPSAPMPTATKDEKKALGSSGAEEEREAEAVYSTTDGQTSLYAQDTPPALEYLGELFKTYILAQWGEELCLIDKHAAHERQLFEKLAANYGKVAGQLLLTPLTVELSAEEKQAVLENRELLENAGLEISDFGGKTVVLHTVPADVAPTSAEDLLVELADKLAKGSRDALNERTEWILHSISCKAAVKAGDRTSPKELMLLAEKILSGEVPPFCPHGRPCLLRLTRKELEKQFGRIV